MTPHSRGNTKWKLMAGKAQSLPSKRMSNHKYRFMLLLFLPKSSKLERNQSHIHIQSTKKLFFLNLKLPETARKASWSSPGELSPLASPNLTKNEGSGWPRAQKCFELINLSGLTALPSPIEKICLLRNENPSGRKWNCWVFRLCCGWLFVVAVVVSRV